MIEAIIYAAGVGRRLQKTRGEQPKILLEFGGRSLLEWHVIRLREVGVSRVTVVAGYCASQIREAMSDLQSRHGLSLKLLFNDRYEEGSVLSFEVSLPLLSEISGPVLLMDGDVLYPAGMLRRLIESPQDTALLIDREYSTQDDDPVLVPIVGGRPVEFVKKWEGEADEVGESIGFFKVAEADRPRLAELTRDMGAGQNVATSYDEVLRGLVREGRFGHEDVTGMPWTEIDFPEDVIHAEQTVLPLIEGHTKTQSQ